MCCPIINPTWYKYVQFVEHKLTSSYKNTLATMKSMQIRLNRVI